MGEVRVVFYREDDGSVPVLDWFDTLSDKAQAKCVVKIERLAEEGHELRRPEADYLRDEIYELRILYFDHGRSIAILAHGLVRERRVPPREIDVAVARKKRFATQPDAHTYREG